MCYEFGIKDVIDLLKIFYNRGKEGITPRLPRPEERIEMKHVWSSICVSRGDFLNCSDYTGCDNFVFQ